MFNELHPQFIKNIFNELHPQLFQLLFDYLTQQELLNAMLINKLLHEKLKQYISNTKFYVIKNSSHIAEACSDNFVISINKYIYYPYLDWNWGLMIACEYGHTSIVHYIIKNGFNFFNYGLSGACKGGHRFLVDLMIENGAKDFNWGLSGACSHGHQSIVNLMIEKGADSCYQCKKSIEEHLID